MIPFNNIVGPNSVFAPKLISSCISKTLLKIFEINKNKLAHSYILLPMGSVDEFYYPDRVLASSNTVRKSYTCNIDQSISKLIKNDLGAPTELILFKIARYHGTFLDSIMYVKTYQQVGSTNLTYLFLTKCKRPELLRLFGALKAKYSILAGGWVLEIALNDLRSFELLKVFFIELSLYIKYIYDESNSCEWVNH